MERTVKNLIKLYEKRYVLCKEAKKVYEENSYLAEYFNGRLHEIEDIILCLRDETVWNFLCDTYLVNNERD